MSGEVGVLMNASQTQVFSAAFRAFLNIVIVDFSIAVRAVRHAVQPASGKPYSVRAARSASRFFKYS